MQKTIVLQQMMEILIKFPNEKKENKQENGFKGLKKIFANNVV